MERPRCPVIVLAGGRSTRMGGDKASLVIAGRPLLQCVIDACAAIASKYAIVSARGQRLPDLNCEKPLYVIEDLYDNLGPLGGIYTGLRHLEATHPGEPKAALVVACDMPLLEPPLLQALIETAEGQDAAVPTRAGLPEPLCAIYRTTCATAALGLIERGDYRVSGLLDAVNTLRWPQEEWQRFDPEGRTFLNVNRPEDLATVESLLKRES